MTFHIARARHYRWSDGQRQWGPFTFSHEPKNRRFYIGVTSGSESYPGCRARITILSYTLCCELPQVIPAHCVRKHAGWDAETVARLGRDWYEVCDEREFAVCYWISEGFMSVKYGAQTHCSTTDKSWHKHLPWTQWRHVRTSLYGLSGEHYATEVNGQDFREWMTIQDNCPKAAFTFADKDGEIIRAAARIEEREWRFGTGWFKWLRFFRRPMVCRSLWVDFDKETGPRKGSWKGGTTGCGIDMLPGELHREAFIRMCAERGFTLQS